MFYSYPQIVLQEVPGEISLALSISGCPLRCKGCHSTETYPNDFGVELTEKELERLFKKYKHISCVLFYGGEWEHINLINFLKIINSKGLKTCLYTGYELKDIPDELIANLDFIKVGPYKAELGGLSKKTTNQEFISIKDNFKNLNYLFNK